jgi:hypothetical protein
MGIPSIAFGFAAPAGTRVVAVTTLDAGGNEIETVRIPSPPGGCR